MIDDRGKDPLAVNLSEEKMTKTEIRQKFWRGVFTEAKALKFLGLLGLGRSAAKHYLEA